MNTFFPFPVTLTDAWISKGPIIDPQTSAVSNDSNKIKVTFTFFFKNPFRALRFYVGPIPMKRYFYFDLMYYGAVKFLRGQYCEKAHLSLRLLINIILLMYIHRKKRDHQFLENIGKIKKFSIMTKYVFNDHYRFD
jgi:hypothetical protein